MNEIKKNIKYLHIIRGFAAFLVVFAHAKWPFWVGGTQYFTNHSFSEFSLLQKAGVLLALLSSNGTAMVIVFFVLSGFMIAYSYEKNNWTYKNFLVNRVIRIYTPYIFSMLLAGLVLFWACTSAEHLFANSSKDYNANIFKGYTEGLTVTNFFTTLTFYRSDSNYFGFNYVYWSLLYEMIFYLFFPLIKKYIRQVFFLSLALHPIYFLLPLDEMQFFPLFFLTQFLFYFSSGVLLFQYIKTNGELKVYGYVPSKRHLQILTTGVFLVGIAASGFVIHKGITFIFAVVFASIWIYMLLKYGARNNLVTRIFSTLGKISYSLYLIHVPVLLFFYTAVYKATGVSIYESPWIHVLFVLFTLPFAFIFYYLFEEFSMKLIEKHKQKVQVAHVSSKVAELVVPSEVPVERQ